MILQNVCKYSVVVIVPSRGGGETFLVFADISSSLSIPYDPSMSYRLSYLHTPCLNFKLLFTVRFVISSTITVLDVEMKLNESFPLLTLFYICPWDSCYNICLQFKVAPLSLVPFSDFK